MRKLVLVMAALVLIGLGAATSARADSDDHIGKVACSTSTGDVIGADTTSIPGLLGSPCDFGDSCVACLAAMMADGCGFSDELPPLFIPLPALGDDEFGVVYHLRGKLCAATLGANGG